MRGVCSSGYERGPAWSALVDLGAQFHALRTALEDCAAGRTRVLAVEAGAGCGKSAFLAEALRQAAASGFLVLRAAGCPAQRQGPLGLLWQLASDPAIPDASRSRLRDALGHRTAWTDPAAEPPVSPTAQRVCAALQQLTETGPVVIGVDDLHHADVESLHCLLQTTGHPRTARLLLLCTALPSSLAVAPLSTAELLRQPAFQRVVLDRLSVYGVSRLRTALLGPAAVTPPADDLLAVTGGNPLLVRALLEEHAESRSGGQPEGVRDAPCPALGGRFYQAVLACLSGTVTAVRHTAGALAVLGETGCVELVARLLGVGRAEAAHGMHALELTGLTASGRLRHPVVQAAALDALDLGHRAQLHRRAAALLFEAGAEPGDIAPHLLAARHAAGPWAVSVLRDAAEQLLTRDEVPVAVSCLELALGSCAGQDQRAEIRLRLAVAARRTDLAAAEDHLAELVGDLRADRLTLSQIERMAQLLLGAGRLEEAMEAMGRLHRLGEPGSPRPETGFHASALWQLPARPRADRVPAAGEPPRPRMPVAAVWDLPGDGTSASAAEAAEGVLNSLPLTDTTLVVVANAVRVLCRTGGCDAAALWCGRLLGEAVRRGLPGWQAQFLALQAELSLCRGLLADAEEYAGRALACVPGRSRSVFAGGPLASRVFAATAMGRYDDATRQLDHPVPESLFHSVYGPPYLRARGHYYLAMQRPVAAVADFLNAGRLLRRWGLDRPALQPWRSEAAEAFLRLGEPKKAEQLLREQLARSTDGNPYVRGVSLRLYAQIAGPEERLGLLIEAVDDLKNSGDRLALARALADLGAHYQQRGEPVRASAAIRRAWRLANDCGARALCDNILPGGPGRRPHRESTGRAATVLSGSELRVAELAASGHTNREISAKLCITVSTVEQHLTRVYKKLKISRRQDLHAGLRTEAGSPA
ncbi:AAA family ATPase [Streptomyces sp. NPDC013455]|uniref:helix-turn-helix transcriptional regulator n=1 Tax=Streptomyces sp. NPDC013455 TaxID=3155605 RepID=UPI0033CFB98C